MNRGHGKTYCEIEFLKNKTCEYNGEIVDFINIATKKKVIAPSFAIGGHNGGEIAFQVATILHQGKLKEVSLDSLRFK